MADRWQVQLFLNSFRQAWPPNFFVVDREKNSVAIVDLDLTVSERRSIILGLKEENYVAGPLPDHDGTGDVWVFGAAVEKVEIYIKLKIFETRSGQKAGKCISFHRAEERLIYPFMP